MLTPPSRPPSTFQTMLHKHHTCLLLRSLVTYPAATSQLLPVQLLQSLQVPPTSPPHAASATKLHLLQLLAAEHVSHLLTQIPEFPARSQLWPLTFWLSWLTWGLACCAHHLMRSRDSLPLAVPASIPHDFRPDVLGG